MYTALVLVLGEELKDMYTVLVLVIGEELTDMYTVHWTEMDTEDRRKYLQVINI